MVSLPCIYTFLTARHLFSTVLWSVDLVSISDSMADLFSTKLWSVYLVFISHIKADLFSTMPWSADLILASNREEFLQGCHLLIVIHHHQTARSTLCTLYCSQFTCTSATLYCHQCTCTSATSYCRQFACTSATRYCHQFTCASAFPLSSPSPGSRCSSGSQTPWGQWLCNTTHSLSV